MDVPDRLRP